MENKNLGNENYLIFMKNAIQIFQTGGIDAVNYYLETLGFEKISEELEPGFYQELERTWIIQTFWKDTYRELMDDDYLYYHKLTELIKTMSKSYKLYGIEGIKHYITITGDGTNIDEFLLNKLEEKCKKYFKICGYFDSLPQHEVEVNGKKIKTINAFTAYNFMDTNLSYDEWIEQNKEILIPIEKGVD